MSMGKIILIQSAKGGSGATTLLTNFSAVLAQDGKRVCMVDACFDPNVFTKIFEIQETHIKHSLVDYIFGECAIEDTIVKLPPEPGSWSQMKGSLSIVLSSQSIQEHARVLRTGYDRKIFADGLDKLSQLFDYVLIDGGASLAEEMLLSMAMSDIVVINSEWKYLAKPTDFIDIAKRLDAPKIFMVLNLVPKKVFEIPIHEFKNNFNQPLALFPNSTDIRDEMGIFVITKPNHPITGLFRKIVKSILDDNLSNSNTVVSVEPSEVKTLFSELDLQVNKFERKLRVFLWHSPLDKPIVQDWYQKLLFEGWIDPWLDDEKLLPGQKRDLEVTNAVESADAVLLFLSDNSVNREGSVQKEIKKILDVYEEKPESAMFLFPVRLDNCDIPKDLRQIQRVEHFDGSAYPKIKKALQYRFQNLPRMQN